MQHTETDQWPTGPVADEPSLAPPPGAAPAPAMATPPAGPAPVASEPVAPAAAPAEPPAAEPAVVPAEPTANPLQTMLDSLANDLHGFIAVVLAHRTNATLVAASSKFPAFSTEAITASMVQWFATSAQALQPMGGDELFGPARAGHIDTEAATIHVRSVGADLGLLVITDPPVHGGVVHATLDILDAYVGTLETLLAG